MKYTGWCQNDLMSRARLALRQLGRAGDGAAATPAATDAAVAGVLGVAIIRAEAAAELLRAARAVLAHAIGVTVADEVDVLHTQHRRIVSADRASVAKPGESKLTVCIIAAPTAVSNLPPQK